MTGFKGKRERGTEAKDFKAVWPGAALVVKSTWKEKCGGVACNLRSRGSGIKTLTW